MNPSTRSSFLAAAALAFAAAGVSGVVADGTRGAEVRSSDARVVAKSVGTRLPEFRSAFASIFGGPGRSSRTGYPRPGGSVKQGQRAARKASNQRRHRRACRKGGRK